MFIYFFYSFKCMCRDRQTNRQTDRDTLILLPRLASYL